MEHQIPLCQGILDIAVLIMKQPLMTGDIAGKRPLTGGQEQTTEWHSFCMKPLHQYTSLSARAQARLSGQEGPAGPRAPMH